jgi:hypothetical protein
MRHACAMSSKGSAHDGLKFVTSVRALLRVAAKPMISDLTGDLSPCAEIEGKFLEVPVLGEVGGLSLNRSKREELGLDGGGDVFKISANGADASGGSSNRPVIGVLNRPVRARLKAVEPLRALLEEDRGRAMGAGDDGRCVASFDIRSKQKRRAEEADLRRMTVRRKK